MDVVINAEQTVLPRHAVLLHGQDDFWLNLLTQLGQDKHHTPIADFFRRSLGLLQGSWLVVSPIHWQVTHNDAMITVYGDELALTEATSRIWCAEVNQFLTQDGLNLIYLSPYCWLINAVGKRSLKSPNLADMHHQSMMPVLAEMDDSMYWQRLSTELQMFLSSHPLNTGRRIPINGVWFWGGGQLCEDNHQYLRPILTDDKTFQQLFKGYRPIDFENDFSEQELLVVIRYPESDLVDKLVKKMGHKQVEWYWNNLAYQSKRLSWYRRYMDFLRRN